MLVPKDNDSLNATHVTSPLGFCRRSLTRPVGANWSLTRPVGVNWSVLCVAQTCCARTITEYHFLRIMMSILHHKSHGPGSRRFLSAIWNCSS